MSSIFKLLGVLIFLVSANNVVANTRIVNSTSNDPNTIGTLPYWLLNATDGDIIDCNAIAGQLITLTASLPAITKSYTINGAGITIDGTYTYQAFQAASGTIVINNIKIINALSKGGDGGDGYSAGGGGVGGGGALYVHGGATVTLSAASLVNNIAKGGAGGAATVSGNAGAGGGGGFGGGNGGSCLTIVSTGGGGGGHSNGGNGGATLFVNGINGIYFGGGGGGAGLNSVVPGGDGGDASPTFIGGSQSFGNGGGGAGTSEDGFSATGSGATGVPGNGGNGIGVDLLFGAGGGGGAASETNLPGAMGIGAAGGGGGSIYSGGTGGILGGGGGAGLGGVGGEGGFGAGGGGAATGGLGGGGFNAGGGNGGSDPSSNVAGGGGGSGLGGAIFVQSDGNLTIKDALNISGNSAIAGIGGPTDLSDPSYIPSGDGSAMGNDIFVREQGTIVFNLSNTLTIASPIEGDHTNGPNTSGGLQKIGTGILKLHGANTYSGLTSVNGGTLNLNGSVLGNLVIGSGGTLSGNATVLGNLTSSGIGSIVHNDITASGSSLVTVAGTASLAGILELNLAADASFGTYTLLTSSGITGAFDAVRFKGKTMSYSLSYLPVGAPKIVEINLLVDIPATVNGSPIINPAVVCCGRPIILGPLPVPGSGPTIYSIIKKTGAITCQLGRSGSQSYLKLNGKNGSCTIVGTKNGVVSSPLTVIAA